MRERIKRLWRKILGYPDTEHELYAQIYSLCCKTLLSHKDIMETLELVAWELDRHILRW